ncbi:GIY-YIG nuclease family protein [Pseudozobellia thermophila]|uniref:GIY-YIG nuclease family protein n=1 Tax=Pseudozobellia thermophila TaxID=192903 RepID=UPI000933C05F|nr:GIY-YIG nuclease family protein [Pseudozobellia thermophila]
MFFTAYVGLTSDLERRLKEHNGRKNVSTKKGVPWKVVHSEVFETRPEARKREKYLKSAAGRRWRKQNIRPRARPYRTARSGGAQKT